MRRLPSFPYRQPQPFSRRCLPLARTLGIAAVAALITAAPQTARAQTYALTTLANFDGTNGADPLLGVTIASNGNMFGTTEVGANNEGSIFELLAGSTTPVNIADFAGSNGLNPQGGLTIDGQGNLLGTTTGGGTNSDGTVFEVAAGTSTITNLVSFTNDANGGVPQSTLFIDGQGNLIGTAQTGGTGNNGTVFEIQNTGTLTNPIYGTNAETPLFAFNGTNGATPLAGLVADSHGNLYGTTYGGGTASLGTVFEIQNVGTIANPIYASSPVVLANFNSATGGYAGGLTIDSKGDLFGTTDNGAANGYGSLFEVTNTGTASSPVFAPSALSALASFDGVDGFIPSGNLAIDASGNLFGESELGGAENDGNIFEYSSATNTLASIATFDGTGGVNPAGGLTFDSTGDLIGTTGGGGANSDGTIFKVSPVGAAAAPEPTAFALLALGSVGTISSIVRRKRGRK